MQRLRKQHEPTWVWRYKHHTEVLQNIRTHLTLLLNESIPDSFVRMLNVKLHPLHFSTGKTFTDPAASFDYFFIPTDKRVSWNNKNEPIERTIEFPESLGKPHKPSSWPTDEDIQLQKDLEEELQKFCRLADSNQLSKRMTPIPRPKNMDKENVRTLAGSVNFHVSRAVEHRHGARVITLVPEAYPNPARPSSTEIQVLITVITQGLRQQSIEFGLSDPRARTKLHLDSVNYVIPTLIISVYPGAHVRVLYGYMVNNELHLHFTELQQFNNDNFPSMMEETLRWAFPIARGQAAKLITLPDLMEIDEEDDVEVEVWEDVEDCTVHLYTTHEEVDDHVQGTNQECMMNFSSTTSTFTTTTTRKIKGKKNSKKKG
ncbi:uncharacterized protein N7473_013037 [Penicillium subrubescens]|uniref:Uncharacterized protein n=1 Tax=Penicillium subrubescens TaxID=1316194 RepID=A0A1Q5U3E3_9EURO|nr:uncharacterized protein N7473_013037 [Penicillium subrubescens]KAJ5875690.1 hypothetical protein N7473_013037 [Penicillium subrubescens]OKP06997.1 hypothetical protein PENSUB_6180 [Penicillium subrubescens]